MPRVREAALATVILCISAVSAFAGTIRVPKDHPTIQAAVDAAVAGDVIVVKGQHTESVSIVGRSQLTIRGVRATVESVGASAAILIEDSSEITVTGIKVRSPAGHGIAVFDSTDVRVSRCKAVGTNGAGIYLVNTIRCTVERCSLADTAGEAIYLIADGPIDGAADCVIRKNRIARAAYAIDAEGTRQQIVKNRIRDDRETGIYLTTGAEQCTVSGNRITGSLGHGIHVGGSATNTVQGNTIVRVVGDGISVVTPGHLIEGNSVLRATGDGIDIDAGSVSCNLNHVELCGGNGIDVDGTLCSIVSNRVVLATGYGFAAAQGNSNFLSNRSTKSGLGGFLDAAGGGNVLVDNDFR